MKGNHLVKTPGELYSPTEEGIVASADGIYDYIQKKKQETINSEIIEGILVMQEQINAIIDSNTMITATFNPTVAKIGIANSVEVTVSVNKYSSSIEVWRGDTQIGGRGSGTTHTVEDIITPDTLDSIIYTIELTIGGKILTRQFSLPIEKRNPTLSWSASTDVVKVKDAASHSYPTLVNSNSLSVTYTSTNSSVASIDASTGVITLQGIAGITTIKAVFAGNDTFNAKTVQYTLTVLSAADYYVGWATGDASGFDAFTALTAEQLVAMAKDYSKIINPSITKTVTSAEATGSRQIFFLMWKDDSAPQSGSVTSGGITDSFSAANFVDDNVFRATHANITVNDNTYHVHGMRGAFDAGDVFVVNF